MSGKVYNVISSHIYMMTITFDIPTHNSSPFTVMECEIITIFTCILPFELPITAKFVQRGKYVRMCFKHEYSLVYQDLFYHAKY